MSRLTAALTASLAAFIAYLVLSAGSATQNSTILLWSLPELITGLLLALLTGIICRKLITDTAARFFNPKRWALLIAYLPLFLFALTIANLKTAWSVLTGKNIRPAIVEVKSPVKTNTGALLLSASVTFQPGTAVVEANDKDKTLYIHMLDAGEKPEKTVSEEKIFSKINLAKWIRRITQ